MGNKSQNTFSFVDLFAGIGGFHQALESLGGRCTLASEIDKNATAVYEHNFPDTNMRGDVNTIPLDSFENFDVLCAGFPCQPFSKAGKRLGFEDPTRGGLFYKILDIIDAHRETIKFLLLENVRNLADNKEYWHTIVTELKKRNFIITEDPLILSPTAFGEKQERERVYVLGVSANYASLRLTQSKAIEPKLLDLEQQASQKRDAKRDDINASDILEYGILDKDTELEKDRVIVIEAWAEFFADLLNKRPPGFTVWLHYFGLGIESDDDYRNVIDFDSQPKWKQNIILNNRSFYISNKRQVDKWVKKYTMDTRKRQFQKFEWNAGLDVNDIKKSILQFRQSGLRIKRPNTFPTLVAKGDIPIIWDNTLKKYGSSLN